MSLEPSYNHLFSILLWGTNL